MKVITVANQKGGVGKTTVAAHLMWYLRKQGKRVVGIDLDSQGNLSDGLRRSGCEQVGLSTELFIGGKPPGKGATGFGFFAGSIALLAVDYDKNGMTAGSFGPALKLLEPDYDYCIIDTPPAWGARLNVAIGNSDISVIPIELEKYSIDGLSMMRRLIAYWQDKVGKPRPLYLVNRMNSKSSMHKKTIVEVLKADGGNFIPRPLKMRSALGNAAELARPVWEDTSHGGRDAAKEIIPVIEYILEQN